MPHGKYNLQQTREMNESIVNHLFLPTYLPTSADSDFCLRSNHRNEYVILECLNEFFNTYELIDATLVLPIVRILMDCTQRWSMLQRNPNLSVSHLQSTINGLLSGAFLPMYFHKQNAALMIEIDENNPNQALISSWQVLLPVDTMTCSVQSHLACFPVTTYRLIDRSCLSSTVHCELLLDFIKNTIEYSKSYKSTREILDTRDVPASQYVSQWWIQQFSNISIENNSSTFVQFSKKHRDQVRSNNRLLPFRRSGLWMSIKIVFQTILTKRLHHIGIVIYKLLITHFLTHIIYTQRISTDSSVISSDLLVHCIRKILRRLNKIDNLLSTINVSNFQNWIQSTKQDIQKKIDDIFPKMNWQHIIQLDEQQNRKQSMHDLNFNDSELYRHSFVILKNYLNSNSSKPAMKTVQHHHLHHETDTTNSETVSFKILTDRLKYRIGIALTYMEIWVISWLEQWLNQPLSAQRETDHFQMLSHFYDDYQTSALDYYCSKKDPTGYSRFILTSLMIIRVMHEKLCQDQRFERLKVHCIDIPNLMDLFEYLILPTREEMIRARQLYDYFHQFMHQSNPDLLSNIEDENSFGVHFATHSTKMNSCLRKLQSQIEKDKATKIQEVRNAKDRYNRLMTSMSDLPCKCYDIDDDRLCHRCRIERQADSIDVDIYECPIPSQPASALAVMFELRMPIEIRCYRDVLWQFVNRSQYQSDQRMYEWLRVLPHSNKLQPLYTGPTDCKVKLISSTNSISQSDFANPLIGKASIEDFLYENSLQVKISPARSPSLQSEFEMLTPQLEHSDYKSLQYAIQSTQFMQNQVLADLVHIQSKLQSKQFVEFGSFRSGHRLQWWNLLTVLEMDSLSLNDESVAILIMHSILQYGPLTDELNCTWCPESHQQLLDDDFVDELILRLNRYLDECAGNWQNEIALIVITMITMRMLTVCNTTRENQVVDLALKCRRLGEQWIDMISISNLDQIENLRLNILIISIACLLTFSTRLLSSNQHMISLLKAATTVHENLVLNKKQTEISIFLRNLIRSTERLLVQLQPTINEFLQRTAYSSLNKFATIYWAAIRNEDTIDIQWEKRMTNIYDGWYDGQYQSNSISIDCLQGIVLINRINVAYLPPKIFNNELYLRVFEHFIFQVQIADTPNTYITKHTYHGDEQIRYEFYFDDSFNRLIVHERHMKTNELFELIPWKCLETELPMTFVSEYSHWKNVQNQFIEFRPVHFNDPNFFTQKSYILNIETGYITTSESTKTQVLINQSSALFENWFLRYFIRLDEKPYVYMIREDNCVHIHLSRLAIAFTYQSNNQCFISREYADMCIDEEQWLGTLTGLRSGLLLSPIESIHSSRKNAQFRKLIVPFGYLYAKWKSSTDHQIITLQRKSSMLYANQYFVFILNDRLRILQSTDSPTGWLYLALLHALTSHPLPDQYTGMTGMERAFQLLNSAGCWTDQPFDSLSLAILQQIATISPKATYSKEYGCSLPKIDWNSQDIPYSLQHCGYYLIVKKLIETSEKLIFMHSSSHSNENLKLIDSDDYDEKLLIKLYWDYHNSYNSIARLSTEIETELLNTITEVPYRPTLENRSSISSQTQIHLINDMYSQGDIRLKDISEIKYFPLSQWLTDDYKLNIVWIGLLKLADSLKTDSQAEKIERFQLLLNFLEYTSDKRGIRPIYLQILKTVLYEPSLSIKTISFPSFTQYHNIQHTTAVMNAIEFNSHRSAGQRRTIFEEVKKSFEMHHTYKDQCRLATSEEKNHIKFLLKSWQLNKELHTYLIDIQNLLSSHELFHLNIPISVSAQEFRQKSIEEQYQIEIQSIRKQIDQQFLQFAQQKYLHSNTKDFIKPIASMKTTSQYQEFPAEIFSSIENDENNLNEIGKFFKNQLKDSWKQLQLTEHEQKQYPTKEQLIEFLDSLIQQSTHFWKELIESIVMHNEQLFEIGLLQRPTPANIISLFHSIWLNENEHQQSIRSLLTKDQCILLGGLMVNWVIEQQIERALHFLNHDKHEEFEEELSNPPHSNWIPSEHLPWLIFELEMNITIRAIQVDVARHMMQTNVPIAKNMVMQMNMGEGKTSVIIPMLALSLCSSSSSLVRIVVLKSLFPTNYQSLRFKLGGLLNRRIFPFTCRRDMNFNSLRINDIFHRFQQGLRRCDIVLVSPEDILSFDLFTIDKCRRQEFETGRSMLIIQRWLKTFIRDIFDESDEILHCKYQLIYTVGCQQQIDGGEERWRLIQWILHSVKRFANEIVQNDPKNVFYKSSERKSSFPEFRLLSHQPFRHLSTKIVHDWLNQKSYRKSDKERILLFILNINTSIDILVDHFPPNDIQLFLIVRGLLSSEVLFNALIKRYRVNYGVNSNPNFNRSMAVPFRAKDVAADRTEFGHPDIALILTQLSYYYSGLNDSQLLQCFERLNQEERDPESIYVEWISEEDENDVPKNLQQWKGVNLKDYKEDVRQIFDLLRYNMLVIDYFLNYFVFPREAKQFPYKLISSAWDLSSSIRTNRITGFSGTNDTQLLLPIHIQQCDLFQLQKTDAIVINNLLQSANENYQHLPVNATSEMLLSEIVKSKSTINVILDVGALFIDGTNREIAIKWLKLSDRTKIDYAIYFEADYIVVCDRQFQHNSFLTSPANERLDRCLIYLDEVHTRGTDFKFPSRFKAAVTLGNGLTKDRFVQACMRMRQLGRGHSLAFWSSNEVHQQIISLKTYIQDEKDSVQLKDILRWVYNNTQRATWDGLHYWAVQSLSFQRKVNAFERIQWIDHQQTLTDELMKELAEKCLESEIIELKRMYGVPKVLATIAEIYTIRHQQSNIFVSDQIHQAVLKRLKTYSGSKQRLSQFLDEEQQRELEQELEQEEEREQEHEKKSVRSVCPCEPILHDEIKKLCNQSDPPLILADYPLVFRPLAYAFTDSIFSKLCQCDNWQSNLWISTEFQRVIETKGEILDLFLRPPRWIVVYRNEHIIYVNAYEANWLIEQFHQQSTSTLRLLLPRLKRNQSIFVNTPTLTIPPLIQTNDAFILPVKWLVELFVFNGTIYFETVEEQTAYCQYLALCLKPRTVIEENAFEDGWIDVDGYVQELDHRKQLQIYQARFTCNPLLFLKELLKNRNHTYPSLTSHIGSIIYRCLKPLSTNT